MDGDVLEGWFSIGGGGGGWGIGGGSGAEVNAWGIDILLSRWI